MAKQELLATIRDRYRASSKKDKGRILDEFIAVTGHHRKHGIRLLGQSSDDWEQQPAVKRSRRIYDEAVGEAVIVVWEAADRICGKRLKAALPHLVESMERHGHLDLDPGVRQRLLAASAATLDRLLQPIRTPASRRLRRRRRQSPGRNIPVRTFADWNAPPPGFLEIDLVVHHGGSLWGSMIHSLVATDICTGWTEAVPLLAREQSLVVAGLEAIGRQLPFPVKGIDSDNDSVFINETLTQYCAERGIEFTRSRPYRKNDQAWIEQKNGAVVRHFVARDRALPQQNRYPTGLVASNRMLPNGVLHVMNIARTTAGINKVEDAGRMDPHPGSPMRYSESSQRWWSGYLECRGRIHQDTLCNGISGTFDLSQPLALGNGFIEAMRTGGVCLHDNGGMVPTRRRNVWITPS